MEQERESIWTVAPGTKDRYFLFFYTFLITGLVLAGISVSSNRHPEDSFLDVVLSMWGMAGSIAIGSAAVAMFLAESIGVSMVLADRLRRHFEKRDRRKSLESLVEELQEKLDEARRANRAEAVAAYQFVLREAERRLSELT